MASAKQLARRLITGTGLHRLTELALGVAAGALLLGGRAVGTAYGRTWSFFGRPYFDQRFSHLRGLDNWQWCERGVAAAALMREDHDVLELACGDGLYAATFFAPKARHVDAIDLDPAAIAHARRRYPRPNLKFHLADVLADPFPRADYDVVCCFATFQYFTPEQAAVLLKKIGRAIAARNGSFIGSVPVYPPEVIDASARVNFRSTEQIHQMLHPHFADVRMWSTRWGRRSEEYFICRDPLLAG